jgi:hypothetical protein
MKQAVVVIHGMGEQIPMQTLRGFVDTVWVQDSSLVRREKPDPNTGGLRGENVAWSKPDKRNRSYELHRITTEQDVARGRTDFYEFYWAHLVHGTKFEQVKSWIMDLLMRNPLKRVPKRVMSVWIALWVVTLALLAIIVYAALPAATDAPPKPIWLKIVAILVGLAISAAAAWFVNTVMVKIFGDVVRYTSARPENIARRQEIREKGVELLETLMGIDLPASKKKPYDRIVVVAHSLGTIVAYDILTHAFARHNASLLPGQGAKQPKLKILEDLVREATNADDASDDKSLVIDTFQKAQDEAREEFNKLGHPWIISDFITVGSPLGHADFLMAYDENELHQMQTIRQFPTCPPTMEFDLKTKQPHFTYLDPSPYRDPKTKKLKQPTRIPHHGAVFGLTRWSNIHSPRHNLIFGDVVSGPVGPQFGLKVRDAKTGKIHKLSGIRDMAVLPERSENGVVKPGHSVPFMTHTKYWNMKARTGAPGTTSGTPHHIQTLRSALNILRKKQGEG